MICPNCNAQVADGLRFCSNCGKPLSTGAQNPNQNPTMMGSNLVYSKNPPLSPWLSLLNFFIPGVAQLIYGQVIKGIAIFAVSILLSVTGIGVLVWLISIPDAYMVGNCLQNGKPVGQWQFFPS